MKIKYIECIIYYLVYISDIQTVLRIVVLIAFMLSCTWVVAYYCLYIHVPVNTLSMFICMCIVYIYSCIVLAKIYSKIITDQCIYMYVCVTDTFMTV